VNSVLKGPSKNLRTSGIKGIPKENRMSFEGNAKEMRRSTKGGIQKIPKSTD
jgi:hypothetical protein